MLPRPARLRRSRDFQAVYRTRKSWASPGLSLHVRWEQTTAGGDEVLRFGYVISNKVAKRAHVRNLLKRRMREISRLRLLPYLRKGRSVDLLFVARPAALALDFEALAEQMGNLMRQAGLPMGPAAALKTLLAESIR